jgi:DNA-binding transcriptional regulator YhcF (GntR family)
MAPKPTRRLALIETASLAPKYRQIIENVQRGIERGELSLGDRLPSITEICRQYGLSRDTAVKAYDQLESQGVVEARHGQGFFVATRQVNRRIRVFVMFDLLSNGFKERVYQGLLDAAGGQVHFDFYSHNFNEETFCHTLEEQRGRHEYYIVMPFLQSERVKEALARLDQEKLLLLDIDLDFPGKACAVIRQSHNEGLEQALESAAARFLNYERFELVFPEHIDNPQCIKAACRRFCKRHKLPLRITSQLDPKTVRKGTAYLVIYDTDLVALVKELHQRGWKAGRDVGIVSYNDTPLKEIAEGGITVASIDFHELGHQAGIQVRLRKPADILIPTRLIQRKTL